MNLWNLIGKRQSFRAGDGEPPSAIGRTGAIVQERAYLDIYPQIPPTAVAQGLETPSRPARYPIAILFGSHPDFVAEGRFRSNHLNAPPPIARYPLTRQLPERPRANIPVPPHIAYGSIFTSYAGGPPYG